MWRSAGIYGGVLALSAFALEWWEHQHLTRVVPEGGYIAVVAIAFIALGVWIGRNVPKPSTPEERAPSPERVLAKLGVTAREFAVLELIAAGQSNKEIARSLDVSPNTVKTHLRRLYDKLGVERRTQAVRRAQELQLLP